MVDTNIVRLDRFGGITLQFSEKSTFDLIAQDHGFSLAAILCEKGVLINLSYYLLLFVLINRLIRHMENNKIKENFNNWSFLSLKFDANQIVPSKSNCSFI